MGILDTLKISNVKRSMAPGADPVQRARTRLIAGIEEQKRSVEAELKNESYKSTRKKAGEVVDKRFRPWWFKHNKAFYSNLRYGTSTVELPGGNTIEAGERMEDLLTLYDKLIEAVEDGELDKQLKQLSEKRGRRGPAMGAERAAGQQRAASGTRRR